jgi:peptidyl-prolyl cis-trans isomerase SurA
MSSLTRNARIYWLSVLVVALIVVSGTAHGATYTDRIVAIVNGDVILESDLKKHKQPFMRGMFSLPLGVVPAGKWPTERELLDELIIIQLLEQEATKKGVNVDDQGVDASVDSIRKRNNLTQDQFVVSLAASGINYTDYRNLMKRQIKLSRLIASEVVQKVPFSEEDAQVYFKKNRDKIDEQFKKLVESQTAARPPEEEPKLEVPTHEEVHTGGTVRLQRIVLSVPKSGKKQDVEKVVNLAKKIYEEAMAGADFGKLAQKYSQDALAKKGGDLGPMNYNDLVPELQKIVQRMKPGLVTPPMKGPEGLMILYLADAKNRTTKKIPVPEQLRKQYEKQIQEVMKKREAEKRRRAEAAAGDAKNPKDSDERDDEAAPNPKGAAASTSGTLTPEEYKEYTKVRKKVISVLRTDRIQARMKEWIDELKKNSIIEVKL